MKNRSLFSCFYGATLRCRASLAAVALLALGNGFSNAAPGVLDAGFGTGGIVNTDVAGGDWDSATGMAVYATGAQAGKIVLVGYTDPTGAGGDVLVSRYNANGTLDTGFGSGGHVIIDVNSAGNADSANAVTLAADGSVFVVGFTSDNPDYDLADLDSFIMKLNSTGALDTSFNGTGYVVQPLAVISNDEFRGVALQSDGKVVAVGQATNDSTNDMTVVRYNVNGSLDTTFNNSGILFVNVTVEDFAEDVVIQSADNKIVVVGETHGLETLKGPATDMAMIRVNTNGTLDTTFGKAGKVITSFSLSGFDRGEALTLNTDGSIVVAGRTSAPNGAVIARFTPKGALDTKFGTKGLTITSLSAPPDDVSAFDYGSGGLFGSLAIQGDGKILFCGYEYNGVQTQAVVLRYSALGIPDSSFGTAGKVVTLEGEYSDGVQTVISGGKIVVAGTTIDVGGDANLLLMQYDGDVTLTTLAAGSIGNTSALLNGSVTGDGSSTNVTFLWGLSSTALTNTLAVAAPVTGTSATPVSATLGFLKPGVKYYYRVAAGGAVGAAILDFTTTKTVGVSPVAKTLAATSVDQTSAILNGTIDAKSTNLTNVQFQWGTTLTYANASAGTPATVNAAGLTNVSLTITGLIPNTKYNFRLRGASSVGSSDGANLTFTTTNHSPVAVADSAEVTPNATVTIPVLNNDTDADGNALKIASFTVSPATAGKASILNNKLVFVASATFTGATITYVAGDAFKGLSAGANVTVSVPTITLGSSATTVAAAGGAVSFSVTAPAGAAWLAKKTDAWITLFPITSSVGSGTVLVTVAANKAAGRSAKVKIGSVEHTINQNAGPALGFAAASFSGLVAPDSVINGKVGGSLTLASAALGTVTGKLVLGATTYALKGFLTDGDATAVNDRQFVAFITRKTPLAPLRLQLTYNSSTDSIGFGVNDGLTVNGLGSPVLVRGYRLTYSKTSPAASAPLGYAAPAYTMALEPTWDQERGVPDGDSYATLKVLNTGVATWGGKLADGTALVGSSAVWPTGEVSFFKAFYKNLGSVAGAVTLSFDGTHRNLVSVSTDFPMGWIKPRNIQPAYPGAFGTEVFNVDGAEWKVTTPSILGITTPSNNASVSFSKGEIEQAAFFADGADAGSVSDLTQVFTIGTVALKNKVTPDLSVLNNPGQVKITAIDSVKGTFKGTMTLKDPSKIALGKVPAGTSTPRVTPFEGVLIDDGVSNQRGTGFGLLQTLPDSSEETATKTPKLSFLVTLNKL